MCRAVSRFYYGITIKALDFCLLATAWNRSRPALLAIDLVLARRARGRLEVKDSVTTDVRALPVEMWDLVRAELVDEATEELYEEWEDDWLSGCDCCSDWDVKHLPGGRCADLFSSARAADNLAETDGVPGVVEKCVPDVKALLSYFGLCLASVDLISLDEYPWTDLNSAFPVTLPLASDKDCGLPSAETDISHSMGPSHALAAISPSTFILPADADSRFRRLLSTFPILEPISTASDTIRPRLDRIKDVESGPRFVAGQLSPTERRERERAAAAQARRAASEPRWMLWSQGGTCM